MERAEFRPVFAVAPRAAGDKFLVDKIIVDVFGDDPGLRISLGRCGHAVAAGMPSTTSSYGMRWTFDGSDDFARARYLLLDVLQPVGVHWSLPSGHWSKLAPELAGAREAALEQFIIEGMQCFAAAGRLSALEVSSTSRILDVGACVCCWW